MSQAFLNGMKINVDNKTNVNPEVPESKGYRGTVGKSVDYELLRKYELKARKLQSKNGLTYNQIKAYTNRLLDNFITKALKA